MGERQILALQTMITDNFAIGAIIEQPRHTIYTYRPAHAIRCPTLPKFSTVIEWVKRYLIRVGAISNVLVLVAVVGFIAWLDRPFGQIVDGLANHLAYHRMGREQQVGKFLFHLGIANNWDLRAGQSDPSKPGNPLHRAANPKAQFHYQLYSAQDMPKKSTSGLFLPPSNSNNSYVSNSAELLSKIRRAEPGDIINLLPGHYRFKGRSIPVQRPGSNQKPIYVRSSRLGDAILEMKTLEGFHVTAPFWVFENLEIHGKCARDTQCEHAFHVTGKGQSFTLRNSRLHDFNAAIKVNGIAGKGIAYFPDMGLLEYNLFSNTHPRVTENPVTLLNINSVNGWVVRGNFIADFSKNGSDHVSYGAFMKGGGRNGIFEQNLVMCEHRLAPDRGIRIGLSFGGGGTGAQYCRNNDCSFEHSNGVMRNNIILNCSRDVGIYINKGANSQIYNNLLHNTLGIDVRFETSSATIVNNIISGRVKERDGGMARKDNNLIDRHCLGEERSFCSFDKLYADPDEADFRLNIIDSALRETSTRTDLVTQDFCGGKRTKPTDLGPIQYPGGLACLQP